MKIPDLPLTCHLVDFLKIIIPFLWSFLITLYAVPSMIELAWNKGLMDTFEERKVHTKLTPRLGGVAIFAGTFSGILIFTEINFFVQYFLAGILILFFIGAKDDLEEMQTWKKMLGQLFATFLIIYGGEFTLTSFHGFLGINEISNAFLYGATIFFIVTIVNAINFIDGIDGLASALVGIAALTMSFLIINSNPALGTAALCLGGSVVAFLRYNLMKSTVFMGDSGSLISGFIIAIISLQLIEVQSNATGFVFVYAILFVPLTDMFRVILKRIIKGRSPFKAGRDHIHHILVDSGYSERIVLTILVVMTIISSTLGILSVKIFQLGENLSIFALILLSLGLFVYCEIRIGKITN